MGDKWENPTVSLSPMQRKDAAPLLLIAGLAFVFGYFGIDKLVHPEFWLGWIPLWMEGLLGVSRNTWLILIALFEIVLALLLLIPIRTVRKVGALLVALHLVGIMTQVGWNDIAVRDIGLLMSTLALMLLL